MAYERNNLISRPGYSGYSPGRPPMGDLWDTISGAAGGVLKIYGQQQQAAGAAAAAAQTNRDLATALSARQGIDMSTILLLGGAGLVAMLLLRKKKAE